MGTNEFSRRFCRKSHRGCLKRALSNLRDRGRVNGPLSPLMVDRGAKRLSFWLEVLGGQPDQCRIMLKEEVMQWRAESLESLGLTSRQAEVLLWVMQGKTNQEIGIIFNVSRLTIKKHVEHILQKLGVETRTAAAACAMRLFATRSC